MKLKIEKPIRLIELFAGVGSQAKALKRLGANFEHYRACDFDKYAMASYNAIHGTDFATSDITKITAEDLGIVETDKYCYLLTYSFPCQDLSLAGKQKLMAKGSGTRSSLLWEVERLLNECTELPQILLMENVTQVHGTKNKEHFNEWISFLEGKGYRNFWQDLNAKNFGIPQNRNRTFMVSILGDETYEFPKEFPLALRLKDMLEDTVDEKFYLSNEQMGKIVNWKAQQKPFEKVLGKESIVQTITARGAGENHSGMIIFSSENENTTNMQAKVKEITQKEMPIVNGDICKTVRAGGKGSLDHHSWDLVADHKAEPKVIAGIGEKKSNGGTQWYQQDRIYKGDVAISVTTAFNPFYAVQKDEIIDPFVVASRGRNPENPSDRRAGIPTEQRLEPNFSGCTNTLTTVQKDNYVAEPVINRIDIPQTVRVRKYEVDCEKLCGVLRDCKSSLGLNNQDIARYLNIPLTKVEHWFRQDKYFAIPDENIWFELKALLGVNTDEFDEAITTFEEKEGVFEKSNRCYLPTGIAPTVTCASNNEKIVDPIVCEQRKDEGLRFFKGDYCGTLRTIDACGDKRVVESCDESPMNFRIRKLTPKECWRLMGFEDEDFEKAARVNSNTQLYKQAGNSIVVDVLYHIFREML